MAKPQRRDMPGEENQTFYEPRGVSVAIAPWNFPLAILCGMTTAALAAGNTAIMKPAEQSPIIAAKLMEVFTEAGLPHGVVNYLPGLGEEVGPVLVSHPDVAVIAFTGSRGGPADPDRGGRTPPGQYHLKKVITEMGGKNAIIIDDGCGLGRSRARRCGQCLRLCRAEMLRLLTGDCVASVHEVFLQRLIEATRSLKIGPAEDPSFTVGPVIEEDARRRILADDREGKNEAKLVYAGGR